MSVFTAQVDRWFAKADTDIKSFTRVVALKLLRRVVERTPVDTGRARASWNMVVGVSPNQTVEPDTFRGGASAATNRALARGAAAPPGLAYVISNSLPYISVLENGGYPNPPKRGSWDRVTKRFVVKSVAGFSRQAPAGMVGLAIADTLLEIEALNRASGRRGGGGARG